MGFLDQASSKFDAKVQPPTWEDLSIIYDRHDDLQDADLSKLPAQSLGDLIRSIKTDAQEFKIFIKLMESTAILLAVFFMVISPFVHGVLVAKGLTTGYWWTLAFPFVSFFAGITITVLFLLFLDLLETKFNFKIAETLKKFKEKYVAFRG